MFVILARMNIRYDTLSFHIMFVILARSLAFHYPATNN